jgi:hypothetical protein
MASLNAMVKQCSGMLGTKDLSDWEEDFVASVCNQTRNGDNTTSLTEKQITVLERIFKKHFSN